MHPSKISLGVDGDKPPSARKLTPDQEKFHRDCPGPIHVVTCLDEALTALGYAT